MPTGVHKMPTAADGLLCLVALLGWSALVLGSPVQTPLDEVAAVAAGVTGNEMDSPANRLYRDALRVVESMKDFLPSLSKLEQIQVGEAQREDEIRMLGVKRGNSGFKVNGWKRKRRSTMESDILAVAFTNKLDHKAADMVRKIYTFLDDLQIARQYYEGPIGSAVRSSMDRSSNPMAA